MLNENDMKLVELWDSSDRAFKEWVEETFYDYSKGKEAYVLYFTDEDGASYAYYCQNGESPIFTRINDGDYSPMKISCQVKEPLEYPAEPNAKRFNMDRRNWILRPRLLK